MFMYGEQNASLSDPPTLAANGVELAEIPRSGHWPMYSNPLAMWNRIATFQTAVAGLYPSARD
jgi:pimeloyl-ACP methyl ester carboxylesterase